MNGQERVSRHARRPLLSRQRPSVEKSDPSLSDETREGLVKELMSARRAVKEACGDIDAMREARSRVNDAKTALGERGPVWWSDGAPDCNRRLANTGYATWYASLKSGLDRR